MANRLETIKHLDAYLNDLYQEKQEVLHKSSNQEMDAAVSELYLSTLDKEIVLIEDTLFTLRDMS